MELLVQSEGRGEAGAAFAERAFLVGMLSMADALLGRPIESLVQELCLSEEVGVALTLHEGELGDLLAIAEAIEKGEVEKFEPALAARDLDLAALQTIENDVYAWVHGLMASGTD